MGINKIDAKIQIKYSTITTIEPSIPTSNDHTDGSWNSTDVYIGELFLNSNDDKLFIRTINGIQDITIGRTDIEADLGDWNMDISDSVTYNHGLSATEWKTIRNISVTVRDDSDNKYYDFVSTDPTNTLEVNSTIITIAREIGGLFDGIGYDSVGYNRGWISFYYKKD